ncbi:MAG: twin-arginine translocase subunit TatC [Thermoleophilia bacterium]|nr:twin-arginine translocase subunit TatC [Thermoleophilia bacterium]
MTTTEHARMSIIEHLGELRRRIVISTIAICVAVAFAFIEKDWVFRIIMAPLVHGTGQPIKLLTLSPTEPFMSVLKVSIYFGLLLALPVILWQLWAFIMPALYENEKKRVLPYVLFTTVLFAGGVLFGYYVVLPIGLKFLVGYGGDIFDQQQRAGEYISFVTLFLLAFGVVFEMPAIMVLLASAGIVSHHRMRRSRKYALIGIAFAAMVLTPSQDPVSMLLMMGPLVLLYELGILLARIVARRRVKREREAAAKEAAE